jgi:predicted MFS family arabinose efflux permease
VDIVGAAEHVRDGPDPSGPPRHAAADDAVTPARWAVLGAYALLAASTQLLWHSFAPITTEVAGTMHVDVGLVGDLAVIFPVVYIVLALPTGRWLDANFAHALGAGAMLTAAGAMVRIAAPSSFVTQLAGQLVIATGQPLVLNSITKVAARHFPAEERATAISIGTVALFLGILVAVLTGGPLLAAGGLSLVLDLHAGLALCAAALMIAALRVAPAFRDDPSVTTGLRWLAGDRLLWTLAALIFIGMGTYNAVATWLEPILDHYGEKTAAGNLIAGMTFAGIVGAATLAPRAAARDVRRVMLVGALAISVVAFTAMALRHDVVWLAVWLAADGLVLMACLPVVLDWSGLHVGLERQGAAAGFLMLSGNLGGVVLVLLTQVVIDSAYLPLLALAAAGVVGVPIAMRLPAHVAMPLPVAAVVGPCDGAPEP